MTPPRSKKPSRPGAPPDISTQELRARVEVASHALREVRSLLADVDPVREPARFAERERQAMAILEELPAVLPLNEPLAPAERAALEASLEDAPDDETIRAILALAVKLLEDPSTPPELRAELEANDPRAALARVDHAAILQEAVDAARELADDLTDHAATPSQGAFAPKPPKPVLS